MSDQLKTKFVERQAGGHFAANGDAIIPNLQRSDGTFLKLIRPRYYTEVAFYEDVFSTADEAATEKSWQRQDKSRLQNILPRYYGLCKLLCKEKEVEYIVLEDLTKRFQLPCVLDVKLKADIHDPQSHNSHPVIPIAKALGFLIDGITVFNVNVRRYECCSKSMGRRLTPNDLQRVLMRYVNGNRDVILNFIERLKSVESWASKQRSFQFYRSSLLFVYDAAAIAQTSTTNDFCDVTDVRLIDFAKVYPSTVTDDQLVNSLVNLRTTFDHLLDKESSQLTSTLQ